jgi:hypothetical protein
MPYFSDKSTDDRSGVYWFLASFAIFSKHDFPHGIPDSRQTNSMLCSRIPYGNKQGFDLTEQGFPTQEQGILSAKIKINTG